MSPEPFEILTVPTPSLRQLSRVLDVNEIKTPEFQLLIDRLTQTMIESDGVGIAAPQVGNNIRVIIVTTSSGYDCFINPEITKKSEILIESEEGCLSVPGKHGIVSRHKRVTINALNRHARRVEIDARNLTSIIFQHEIDHLDGILFIDRLVRELKASKQHI